MRVTVVGSNGATGRLVVDHALRRGWEAVAVSRHPAGVPRPGLSYVQADITDAAALREATAGADAVVSAVGVGASRKATSVYSVGASTVIGVLAGRACLLVVVSAAPVGPREGLPWATRRLLLPTLESFFGASYEDMRRMEELLRDQHDVPWVSVRPPRLVKGEGTGYRASIERPLRRAPSLTRNALAVALLDAVDNEPWHGHAVHVGQADQVGPTRR